MARLRRPALETMSGGTGGRVLTVQTKINAINVLCKSKLANSEDKIRTQRVTYAARYKVLPNHKQTQLVFNRMGMRNSCAR